MGQGGFSRAIVDRSDPVDTEASDVGPALFRRSSGARSLTQAVEKRMGSVDRPSRGGIGHLERIGGGAGSAEDIDRLVDASVRGKSIVDVEGELGRDDVVGDTSLGSRY